jgi:hypothetical protein
VGHKGKVNINEYIQIAEVLGNGEDSYCRLNFTSLEYDTTDGTSVYESLKEGTLNYIQFYLILL